MVCAKDECGHERDVKLNLARCIRMADGLFTDLHRAMNQRQRGKTSDRVIGPDEYRAYRNELPHNPAATFKDESAGITINFGRSTIGDYLDSTDKWLEDINRAATDALSSNASDYERTNYIKLTAEVRRLTRHAHHVKSIMVEEEVNGEVVENLETDPAKIVEILEDMSSDRVYVLAFENALARYNDLSRLAVLVTWAMHVRPVVRLKGKKTVRSVGLSPFLRTGFFRAISCGVRDTESLFTTIRKYWLDADDIPSGTIINALKLDTSSLFKQRSSRPITYQEAHDELLSTYDEVMGFGTGENNIGCPISRTR